MERPPHVKLAPAAEALESAQPLAATILYRALIGSILERAQSPAYTHAARYYVELESLAAREDPDWPVERPETRLTELRGRHGRKHGSGPLWKRHVRSGRKSSALAWITASLKADGPPGATAPT